MFLPFLFYYARQAHNLKKQMFFTSKYKSAWNAFGCKVEEKARRKSDHPNTKISHRSRNDKCVGLCAKMTFTADEEDDKSIYNHREDAEEPAKNQTPRSH